MFGWVGLVLPLSLLSTHINGQANRVEENVNPYHQSGNQYGGYQGDAYKGGDQLSAYGGGYSGGTYGGGIGSGYGGGHDGGHGGGYGGGYGGWPVSDGYGGWPVSDGYGRGPVSGYTGPKSMYGGGPWANSINMMGGYGISDNMASQQVNAFRLNSGLPPLHHTDDLDGDGEPDHLTETKTKIDDYIAKQWKLGKRKLTVSVNYGNLPAEYLYLQQYHGFANPVQNTPLAPKFGLAYPAIEDPMKAEMMKGMMMGKGDFKTYGSGPSYSAPYSYSGPNNYQSGPSNYQNAQNNYQSGPRNYQTGSGNFQSDPNNFQAGSGNFPGGSGNFQSNPSDLNAPTTKTNNQRGIQPQSQEYPGPSQQMPNSPSQQFTGPQQTFSGSPSQQQPYPGPPSQQQPYPSPPQQPYPGPPSQQQPYPGPPQQPYPGPPSQQRNPGPPQQQPAGQPAFSPSTK